MSEYLPAFLVDPVLRQARRLSRISGADDSPGILPPVRDFQRWNPSRLWNANTNHYPPPSPVDEDEEAKEGAGLSLARAIQLWTNQLNNLDLDLDSLPSPTLDRTDNDDAEGENDNDVAEDGNNSTLPRGSVLERRQTSERPIPSDRQPSDTSSLEDAFSRPSRSDSFPESQADVAMPQNGYNPAVYMGRKSISEGLPADDGMRELRQRIRAIWSGTDAPTEKSRLIHALMMERYRKSQRHSRPGDKPADAGRDDELQRRSRSPVSALSAASQDVSFNLSKADLTPTYAPLDPDQAEDNLGDSGDEASPELGCMHYQRKVKLQCAACERWYTCRLCHDEVEDHTLPRRETKYMLCMLCNTPQPVGQTCTRCDQQAAYYYCGICKLWNDDPQKKIYHCDDCGICRLGEGLGKDFFHCQRCAACMSISAESTHRCIERSTKCDCPICGEYMFTSNRPVAFMRCGHSIHESCFSDWCKTSYKCPICSKSIANMESQFRRLDRHIEEQPMPDEYRGTRAFVFCNDCNSRSVTPYHWLGLKCTLCESYNTAQLELLGPQRTAQVQELQDQESNLGEAGMTASQSHLAPTEELTSPAPTGGESNASTARAASPQRLSDTSAWLMLPSPTARSPRSMSPVVGSYFGTGQTQAAVPRDAGRTGAGRDDEEEDDDHLDFWGRRSPTGRQVAVADAEGRDEDGKEGDEDEGWAESESSEDSDADDEDDDEDDIDEKIDILGHR